MPTRVVTAFAPATVSNVACGFDVLGFPMSEPGDTVSAHFIASGLEITDIIGDGGRIPRAPEKNTASVAAKAMLDMLGETRGVALTITKGLPLSSGLGGSAASAAAAVVAVNGLCGGAATMDQLVAAALIGEGLGAGGAHPDNIAPAICGGFVLVRHPNPPDIVRLPVPDGLTCVVIHPDLEIETAKARALLGTTVGLKDAIKQWANLGAMVHALHTSDFDLLARTLEDSVAEPKRAPLIPGLANIKKAAMEAGALGSSISGSGPSIFALCRGRAAGDRVAAAMTAAVAKEIGGESQVYVSAISSRGARVIS
ncbi:MAG TPA: homoserine kinase [Vicinamibacterales bacterium]|nr:homoserine kinase [Vicinamibacterales bacterium]